MADAGRDGAAPLRGADAVNDELEVGFDQEFEKSWHRAEQIGRVAMALFLILAIGGVLGRGPFSHRTARAADGSLAVDYEPVTRVQTSTQITFHMHSDGSSGQVTLFVSTQMVEPMGLTRILPQPVREEAAGGGLNLTFAVPPGTRDGHVRLIVQPGGIGRIPLRAYVTGHAPLAWSQMVMP